MPCNGFFKYMHSYLRAVGYSNIDNLQKTEELIQKAIKDPTYVLETKSTSGRPAREYYYECTKDMGICVLCEIDDDPVCESETPVRVVGYFPYYKGEYTSVSGDIFVEKKVDTGSFHGMCHDSRFGIALIFSLQNTVDYLNSRMKTKNGSYSGEVRLSALSLEGRIILPVEKSMKNTESLIIPGKRKAESGSGSYDTGKDSATEIPEDDYFLKGSMILDRARKEDIFSIVDTTFMPHGTETDVYSMVGEITEFVLLINEHTDEPVWLLDVVCKGVPMQVCINKSDLLGVPDYGRRFRGIVWMQGRIKFF